MIDIEKGILKIADKYKNPAFDCYYYSIKQGDGYAKIDSEITAFLDDIGVINRIVISDYPKSNVSFMTIMWVEDCKIMPLIIDIIF